MPDDIRIQLPSHKHEYFRQLAKRADALWIAKDTATTSAAESKSSIHHPQTRRRQPRPIPTRETCVSITGSLVEPLRNAKALVDGWEKSRPATSNGNDGWPKGLPTVHQRQQERKKVPSGHGSQSQRCSCHRSEHSHIITSTPLLAANSSSIRTYGKHTSPSSQWQQHQDLWQAHLS